MEMIKWCMNLKNGIELGAQNDILCGAYVRKAETALNAASALKGNKEWEVSSSYYAMYFSLYAVMSKIGVKCENHNCSIAFMKEFLPEKFKKADSDFEFWLELIDFKKLNKNTIQLHYKVLK